MAAWWFMLLWVLGPSFANAGVMDLAKRTVLSDLSGGFCRSYRFGADIANNVLYMVGLDGGLIPDDGDASNNYLVTLDLTSSFSTSEGKNYKMAKIDTDVPKIKDMAVWSNADNSTLYQYGGRFLENITSEDTIWTYTTKDKSWSKQDGTIQPSRLEYGVYTNAPAIQAGFWIGGYRASGTTASITDSTRDYATGMIQLNTTTGQYTALDGPYEAVEEGSLSYVPVGDKGILVYIGGDVPSIKDGINATMSANSWSHVQVYDIAGAKWYNQSTMGTVASRTQFCASVQHDESSSSYQIYVLGGADLKSKDTILDVNYLSIPSFKWYSAAPLDDPRMTLMCVTYGRQIFGIGGRLAWADDGQAGCYDAPAFIYDAQSEVTRSSFDPTLSSFSLSSSTANDIKASPSPSSWADPAFKTLFGKSAATTSTTANNKPSSISEPQEVNTSDPSTKGAIAGGVVGGVAGLALILGLLWFFVARNKKQKNAELAMPKLGEAEVVTHQVQPMPELPVGARDGRAELRGETHMRWELPADHKREISELDSGGNS
ncbi:uncharacterized protein N7487_002539 [Penicillium crustosum]|uniref:uncharacterized protein n=1 Tax=Penicillium crustosum TaxID=36656 RepID=UPI0023A2AE1D|nr:uncharacterized protein N7487_002539 [Penicillium crustosum]KAJ5418989.1 hypothetical protein N7487_002539 [Penicillium crustosum]